LMLVIGPTYRWPMEYHHQLLLQAFESLGNSAENCLGGGAIYFEVDSSDMRRVQLRFWSHCHVGKYAGELDGCASLVGAALSCDRSEIEVI
jgi:predicted outer membrane repeat protein